MRKGLCLMLLALIVAVAAAQDFGGGVRQPGAREYVGEAGGALVGGVLVGAGSGYALGLAGWYLGGGPTDMEGWTSGILAGLGAIGGIAIGYPIGCGLGTTLIGKATHADGNTGGAYAGAYLGLPVGICLALIGGALPDGAPGLIRGVFFVAGGLAPPVGAVIGYNTGVPDSYSARLAPPSLAYRTRLGPDRQRYAALDCRLVTVRF